MDLVFYVASLVAAFSVGAFWAIRPAPLTQTRLSRREASTSAAVEVRS
ncbi:MAG: hypothetical protein M3O34_15175 [Chloroflexota bacterium]|nr:hypothetical protein [Chloroflexota bacterium]